MFQEDSINRSLLSPVSLGQHYVFQVMWCQRRLSGQKKSAIQPANKTSCLCLRLRLKRTKMWLRLDLQNRPLSRRKSMRLHMRLQTRTFWLMSRNFKLPMITKFRISLARGRWGSSLRHLSSGEFCIRCSYGCEIILGPRLPLWVCPLTRL